MAEMFLFNVAEKVLGKLGTIVAQEVSLAWGVKSQNQFIKLQDTISTIQAMLLDVGEKQAKDHELTDWLGKQAKDQVLTYWLGKVRDALYDAEDLFDEFQCEALQRQVVKHEGIRRKVRNFFSRSNPLAFRLKMGHKIKEVSERLNEIAAEKNKFHLAERNEDGRVVHGEREMSQMTDSFVRVSDVVGRDVDEEKIVSLLMRPVDGENVSIIPIVGIGGLGKTTLAKLVYNDEEVTRHFDLRMWLWVSQNFDVIRLEKEIYKSATGNYDSCVDGLTIDDLYLRVWDTLKNKRYLLIMDDVWDVDLGKWKELKNLLSGGANGSKIIVTTSSPSVSSIMGTSPYNLEGLSHEECLSLFVKHAFRNGEEKRYPNLLKIGDEIVKKCSGLPLTVRTLGELLYMKTEERKWLSVRDSELWDLKEMKYCIFQAFRLSYNAMPSSLKLCFAFCSIFPKGYEFTNFQLIQIWMAQGLLQSSARNQDLEAIGQQYIEELSSRFFFQHVEGKGPFLMFKMHDLMHDLALFVMESNSCSIKSDTRYISERARHLLFSENDFSINEISRSLLQLNHVRTISFPIEGVGPTSESFVETCISRFKYLRMLDLSDSSLKVLPSSIGELKHLGYLDLSRSRSLKKLPDSIYKLPNLQTLGLFGCLELEELPRGKGNFINLRSLSLTTKQMFLPEKKIGHLSSLRFLVIGGCGSLKRLPPCMKCLTGLETLHISHCQKLNLMKWKGGISGLKLRLRSVSIGQLQQSMVLPQWLRAAAKTLEQIRIEDCPNLIALPDWLPSLTELKKLEIINCPELVALPPQMQDCLTELRMKIKGCPKLRSASEWETGKEFPHITLLEETSETVGINSASELETGEEFPQSTLLEETSAVTEITSASEQETGEEFPQSTLLAVAEITSASEHVTDEEFPQNLLEETSEMVEITWSRENCGNFVVSKRETDSTSNSSLPVEDSWWNLDLF